MWIPTLLRSVLLHAMVVALTTSAVIKVLNGEIAPGRHPEPGHFTCIDHAVDEPSRSCVSKRYRSVDGVELWYQEVNYHADSRAAWVLNTYFAASDRLVETGQRLTHDGRVIGAYVILKTGRNDGDAFQVTWILGTRLAHIDGPTRQYVEDLMDVVDGARREARFTARVAPGA